MTMEWFDQLQRDIRLAGRRARRQATFTAVVIVCVTLGVGATASVFSVLHPVLLRDLPFENPDDLVQIAAFSVERSDPDERYYPAWYPLDVLRRQARVFDGVAGFYLRELDVLDGDRPERVSGAEVLPGSFAVLGIEPLLGRDLEQGDVDAGRRVVVIGESFWAARYARDPEILGQTITLGDRPHEIVGVMPGRLDLTARADVFAVHQPADYSRREHLLTGVFVAIGRLPAGADHGGAQRDLDALTRSLRAEEPIIYENFAFDAMPLKEFLVGDFEAPLWALFASALFVLLLAGANVVNLLSARAQAEVWERGLRTALGARCRTLAQQGLVENVGLAVAGGLLGTVAGALGVRALVATTQLGSPAFEGVGLSIPVVALAVGVAVVLGGIMSIVPAARCYSALGAIRGVRGGDRRKERRAQTTFVVAQVALSFVLLVGAGLVARSFANLSRLDLGFETETLTVVRASAPPSMARSVAGRAEFTNAVLERVSVVPGVEAVGAVSWFPFEDGDVGFNHSVEDFPPGADGGERELFPGRIVAPGYFTSMGIPVLAGRVFDERDRMDEPPVAVVSRAFERRHWPDGSAVGKRIKRGAYHLDRPWIEIVGVVEDIRSGNLAAPIRPALYFPQAQTESSSIAQMAYTIRTHPGAVVPASTLRAAVADVSPAATVYGVVTGSDVRNTALGRARFNSIVLAVFAAVGLLLAAAGVFGVTAYSVGRRRHEFALRVALGARPTQVRALVLRHAGVVATVGLTLGLIGATALTRGLDELLYGIGARDVSTYVVVGTLLVVSVAVASYLPARRATRIEPTHALRSD